MDKTIIALGLMRGTSMDGIDASISKSDGEENIEIIGNLYAGDWMFIPWSQTDTSASLKVAATNWPASTGDIPVEYALFHEDTDFLTNA